jgi:hypothetical protein
VSSSTVLLGCWEQYSTALLKEQRRDITRQHQICVWREAATPQAGMAQHSRTTHPMHQQSSLRHMVMKLYSTYIPQQHICKAQSASAAAAAHVGVCWSHAVPILDELGHLLAHVRVAAGVLVRTHTWQQEQQQAAMSDERTGCRQSKMLCKAQLAPATACGCGADADSRLHSLSNDSATRMRVRA